MKDPKDNFLPDNYKIPSNSKYFKPEKGDNKIRILSAPVIGYEYWNDEKKPVRLRELPLSTPSDIGYSKNKDGEMEQNPIRHFWALAVWNYKEERVQIFEITQSSIMQAIQTYAVNPKWGSPTKYDINIRREGDGFSSKYTVMADPASPLEERAEKAWEALDGKLNLAALFSGKDPFGSVSLDGPVKVDDELNGYDSSDVAF